jgi:LPLT family lysophospholipid transporter-like MFS transporter
MDNPSESVSEGTSLLSRGMIAVLVAQFLSAMADNALLFGALALLRLDRYPAWTNPLLQEFFVGAYIIVAPFAGPFADSLPKGRVMLCSNALKLAGSLAMYLGLNPFFAYGLVGLGAAGYSPAKYGILPELVRPELLIKANGLMEASTIAAILVGAIAGGTLADWSVWGTLGCVTGCYAAAAAANLLIPRLAPAHPLNKVSFGGILRDFAHAVRVMVRTPDTRFSMTGTSLFWGTGSTMRFLLVAWVPIALGISNNRMPAYLNGMVAVGIVIGAALASKFIALEKADRALPAGILIGVTLSVLAFTTNLPAAFVIMALIGACGGFFVVPLNALLQETGRIKVGAGHAIAIQNLAENSIMLLMIGLYTLAQWMGMPVVTIACLFGIGLTVTMAALWLERVRRRGTVLGEAARRPSV